MSSKGSLFVIAAPSGAGKTSLVHALLEQVGDIQVSVSHTTRTIRPGEVDKQDYFFTDHSQFEQLIADKAFLEYAEVFDHYYGTTREWVLKRLNEGIDVILEIDWQGARQVKLSYPEAVMIFILPPSLDTLKQRLEGRGQDAADVIAKRFGKAREEISHGVEYDYIIINDDFSRALTQICAVIEVRRLHCMHKSELIAKVLNK